MEPTPATKSAQMSWFRWSVWIFLLAVFLLAAAGCEMPLIKLAPGTTPQASSIPTQAILAPVSTAASTTAVESATSSPADLPPILVEAQPAPGSQISQQTSLTFYFSQPMDQESVQRSLEIKPVISGKFQWIDDSTVKFSPQQSLPPAAEVNFTFNPNVRSKSGKFLPQPVDIHYRTAEPLKILEQLPKPDAVGTNPAAAIVAAFNRPVVPLVGEAANLPDGFTLDPPANGRGEWLNTTTYIFYPQPALSGGVKYTVHINQQLAGPISQDWSFSTALPKIVSVEPVNQRAALLDASIVVRFNQPMDLKTVENNFKVTTPDGTALTGKITWNKDGTQLTFQPDQLLARNTRYTVTISGKAAGAGGTTLGPDSFSTFQTVPALAVVSTTPPINEPLSVYENSYAAVTLNFSAPLARQAFLNLIHFSPDISGLQAYVSDDHFSLTLSGYFQPSTTYTLTLSADLKDLWGQAMGQPQVLTINTTPAVPSFSVPMLQAGSNILFSLTSETTLPARATNLNTLDLTSSPLTLNDFVQLGTMINQTVDLSKKRSWQQKLDLPTNRSQGIDVNLTQSGGKLAPGLYYYQVTSPQITDRNLYPPSTFLLVSSDIQMTLKRSAVDLFVWAVNLTDYTPVKDAEVKVIDEKGNSIGSGKTDQDGIVKVALPSGLDPFAPLYAVIGQPGDQGFSLATTVWSQGVSPWDFGLNADFNDNKPFVYLYTDRPIYRPGQTIHFKAVARLANNGRYKFLDQGQLTFNLINNNSTTSQPALVSSQALPFSAFGTAHGSFTLPEDAAPGFYTLQVNELQENQIPILVANYRKPQIDLQVKFPVEEQASTQDVTASVKAAYFFGAPAGQVPVNWTLKATPQPFPLPDNFQAGKQDFQWIMPSGLIGLTSSAPILQGQGITSADGTLSINLSAADLKEKLDPEQSYQLTLEVTAQDESQQPVSARGSIISHPASFYIGIRPDRWTGQANREIGFDIQSVDWQKQPSGGHKLTAAFQKVNWPQASDQNGLIGTVHYQPETTLIASTDFTTDPNGRARVAFTPLDPGTYLLDVRGEGAVSQVLVWVAGEGAAPWPNLPNQHIKVTADADHYVPGQTAHLFIPNPFGQPVSALITVERGQVMRWLVIQIQGDSSILDVPLTEDDAPNVYISVLLVGRQQNNKPDFREGFQELLVQPAKETLQVELVSQPEKARPGEQANFLVRVKDGEGKPVQGEFSLALVDKAALALADPNSAQINDAFYGPRGLGVRSSLSLAAYSGRIPLFMGGGGGAGGFPTPDIRQQFADTAFWNATIQTDANGQAQISVKLPDNLTTWVADLRGVTQDTRTGQATGQLITTKELIINPVTPRFFVAGDHVQLAAVVINNSTGIQAVDVSLQSTGFALDNSAQAAARVDVPAGGRQRVTWWGTVQDVDAVDLTFTARSANFQDIVKPEPNSLPVLHYSAPQTFGTSGMLAEEGQRQELIALPRSFKPAGGELRVELSPSLAATIVGGLQALDASPYDYSEAVLSKMLPNLEAYRALKDLGIDSPALKTSLDKAVKAGLDQLTTTQNSDGGWGWGPGSSSDPFISAYVLFGLSRASQAGFTLPDKVIADSQNFLLANLTTPANAEGWQLDQVVFTGYVLQQSGAGGVNPNDWLGWRDRLSPWSKTLLALMLQNNNPNDPQIAPLLQDLQDTAVRTATGVHWENPADNAHNYSNANFVTAVVLYGLARLDPASPTLIDAVRYLVSTQQPIGGWSSTFDTAWALMGMTEALKGTGDLQANFSFTATLNGKPLANGQAGGGNDLTAVTASVPLTDLKPAEPNELQISRTAGSGRLYYRAYLNVNRPVDTAPPVENGLSITRAYTLSGPNCQKSQCPPVTTVKMGGQSQLLTVRLTLTLPHDVSNLVVEDMIPAGTEILNAQLKTSQQNAAEVMNNPEYDPLDPFAQGWGWWLFHDPQIFDNHIRWAVDSLAAGTYQLTYQLVVLQPGEYRVIPARAFEYYFPEVQGSSAGTILTIQP